MIIMDYLRFSYLVVRANLNNAQQGFSQNLQEWAWQARATA